MSVLIHNNIVGVQGISMPSTCNAQDGLFACIYYTMLHYSILPPMLCCTISRLEWNWAETGQAGARPLRRAKDALTLHVAEGPAGCVISDVE